jgi:hypothetical protein
LLLQPCEVNCISDISDISSINGYPYLRQLPIALAKARIADDLDALLPWTIDLAANGHAEPSRGSSRRSMLALRAQGPGLLAAQRAFRLRQHWK